MKRNEQETKPAYSESEMAIMQLLKDGPKPSNELRKLTGLSRAGFYKALKKLQDKKDVIRTEGKSTAHLKPVTYELEPTTAAILDDPELLIADLNRYSAYKKVIEEIITSEQDPRKRLWVLSTLFTNWIRDDFVEILERQLTSAVVSFLNHDKKACLNFKNAALRDIKQFFHLLFDSVMKDPIAGLAFVVTTNPNTGLSNLLEDTIDARHPRLPDSQELYDEFQDWERPVPTTREVQKKARRQKDCLLGPTKQELLKMLPALVQSLQE